MKPQPLIAVDDVAASRRWYEAALGLASGHGGDDYEQLMADGEMVLQLHRWEAHAHPQLGEAGIVHGNGVLLWFLAGDFDAALARVRQAGAEVLEGPKINPNARHREIWLRDPDGYVVVVAGPYGDLGA
ncbi:VOC family protein [Pseudoxanthomonas beigongshangi]